MGAEQFPRKGNTLKVFKSLLRREVKSVEETSIYLR